MPKQSAGLIMYRLVNGELEFLLVHPGGPLWAKKDLGVWSIPKGEYLSGEDPLEVARREFCEETGLTPEGEFRELSEIRQAGGKRVKAWFFAGDCDPATLTSNSFTMEWPPRSGRQKEFPEVDRAAWFTVPQAREKILPSQLPLIDQVTSLLQ
ncbi:NUDIX domain-containing protein [Geomonas anaerohicana]|uniref:NUDIX domain-containing protein n=1 Tax=Geomonas anaerohicana TaxID=2798583 RepID=A0ABS0YJK0_9BACT|nr:NUDIX domain-containing protein [Geomonas anaerohicana]MBJ6752532.1 NUDIX domain-containing protein [Geomonas anaerohicana]